MGERYDISFSLKIDISEFDSESSKDSVYDYLPKSMDQVAKTKKSILGL